MFNKIIRFANKPAVRRVLVWLAPIVVGWIVDKIQNPSSKKTTSKKKR